MKKLLTRLDRYIIAKFLGTYVFAIVLIITIAVVFDINEKMDKFIMNDAPVKAIIVDYYMNFIPYFINLFSPLFVFIAVIFFTSKLAENSEIIAMYSSGVSFKRLMRPYMLSAFIIAVVNFVLGVYVIPRGSAVRLDFEDQYVKKKKVDFARNIQLVVGDNTIAFLDQYSNYNATGYRFSLDKFDNKKLVSHLTARAIVYDTIRNNNTWTLKDYMIRDFDDTRERITKGASLDTVINMQPSDFLIMRGQEQVMTSPELKKYIAQRKERGFANVQEFEIEYHKRIAMSFAAFILTTIGAALSSKKVKGGMGLHLGIGLALSFSYILFQTVTSTFAISGAMPPVVAVWIPNILYAIVGVFLYRRAVK